ncbi:MAG: hypothetical protein SO369_01805 [Treponema sp.]|nr:hypothetical protein [Treponema sp.]
MWYYIGKNRNREYYGTVQDFVGGRRADGTGRNFLFDRTVWLSSGNPPGSERKEGFGGNGS